MKTSSNSKRSLTKKKDSKPFLQTKGGVAFVIFLVYGCTYLYYHSSILPKSPDNALPKTNSLDAVKVIRTDSSYLKPNKHSKGKAKSSTISKSQKNQSQNVTPKSPPVNYSYQTETKPKHRVKRYSNPCGDHNGHPLYRGPKGGCYYINSSGKKTYVDRSECGC